MNTHHLHKITTVLILGGVLSVAQTPSMAAPPAQVPLTLSASGILPNIMLMIDNSGSMVQNNVPAPNAALTPANLPADFTYDCPDGTAVSGGSTSASPAPVAIPMKITTVLKNGSADSGPGSLVFCDDSSCSTTTRFGKTSKCFANDKYYNVTYYNGTALSGGPFKGLNLNWYFSTGGFVAGTTLARSNTQWTRMTIAKAAAINLVNTLTPKPGENAIVRLGLTIFHEPQGGRLVIPMTDLKSPSCLTADTSKCNTASSTFKTKIGTKIVPKDAGVNSYDGIQAGGFTPLAETLADIGRYFCIGNPSGKLTLHPANPATAATKLLTISEILGTSTTSTVDTPASLSNNTNGLTDVNNVAPIQYYCQKSSVIMITDGLPNKDREISPHLRDYTGDCAKGECVATATGDATDDLPAGKILNGSSGTCQNNNSTSDTIGLYNIACKNGTKKGRIYEVNGSDYLDDVALALYDMDLQPGRFPDRPTSVKNNLRTYGIGIADPVLQDGILKDAAAEGGGIFAYASDFGALADAMDKVIESIRKGVGSFSAVVANGTQLDAGAAVFQAKYDTASWTGDFIALPLGFINEDTIVKNGKLDPGEDTNGNSQFDKGVEVLPEAWNAGKKMPVWDLRKIYTFNPVNKGFAFDRANCAKLTDTQKKTLGISLSSDCTSTTDKGLWLIDYVRGDISHEVVSENTKYTDLLRSSNNTPDNRIFRNRVRFFEDDSVLQDPWLLGDIVNSDPAYVSNEDYDYANTNLTGISSTERAAYSTEPGAESTFTKTKNSRRKMVYIGANDGLLHGFDASIPAQVTPATKPVTYLSNAEAGKEVLAYLPNAVFSGLQPLSSTNYTHRYFVDGSPKVSDVYFNNAWHTVLVGTTGAGGKSVFALDVTNPDSFTASNVLWELNDNADNIPANINTPDKKTAFTNDFIKNIGYTLPQPYIGKMKYGVNNSKWVAIVANGYDSENKRAVLFVIDIETGDIIRTLDTGTGDKDKPNGLSTPLAIDYDKDGVSDGIIDAIYAGDLLGNMWKFDVSDPSPSNWKVAYGSGGSNCAATLPTTPTNCKPLFKTPCTVATATVPSVCQPITNPPQVGEVGSDQTKGSVMVYFGTGKYFESSDNDVANTQTQSFYGIWDECQLGASNCSTSIPKTSLLQQTIDYEGLVDPTKPRSSTNPNVRTTSSNQIFYSGANAKKGWYIDFTDVNSTTTPKANRGERIVSASLLRGGRIIFATLIPIPITNANDTPDCNARSVSTSWLTELDALSGKRPETPVLDIRGNGGVDDKDDLVTIGGKPGIPASGVQTDNGSTKTPAVMSNPNDPDNEIKITGSSDGKTPSGIAEKPPGILTKGAGRQSWKQL